MKVSNKKLWRHQESNPESLNNELTTRPPRQLHVTKEFNSTLSHHKYCLQCPSLNCNIIIIRLMKPIYNIQSDDSWLKLIERATKAIKKWGKDNFLLVSDVSEICIKYDFSLSLNSLSASLNRCRNAQMHLIQKSPTSFPSLRFSHPWSWDKSFSYYYFFLS